MQTLPQVPNKMQRILTTTADRANRLCLRSRKLTGSRFVETLVFGWLENPEIPLKFGKPLNRFTPEAAGAVSRPAPTGPVEIGITDPNKL